MSEQWLRVKHPSDNGHIVRIINVRHILGITATRMADRNGVEFKVITNGVVWGTNAQWLKDAGIGVEIPT